MPLLIRQIEARELATYEAAGWAQWPAAELRAAAGLMDGPGPVLVALRLPRDLGHQDLMRVSAAPLQGLAALESADGEDGQ